MSHIYGKNDSGWKALNLKTRINRSLLKVTSDKTELNKSVLKWKKYFDEAGKAIGADKKKKK